jgi:hypothetical protein
MKNTRKTKSPKSLKPVRNFCLMLLCGAIMIGGFFFAARQHFVSMDYGMKNSKLRRQLDELEAEKRKLLFHREVSVSPAELKRSAKKAGLFDSNGVAAPRPELASVPAKQQSPSVVKTNVEKLEKKPLIVKTAAVNPINRPTTAVFTKEQKTERPSKRTIEAE